MSVCSHSVLIFIRFLPFCEREFYLFGHPYTTSVGVRRCIRLHVQRRFLPYFDIAYGWICKHLPTAKEKKVLQKVVNRWTINGWLLDN
ncbi:hypothetical protein [Hoylesella pleuritidis]|uniref:hypothetical protein n=1 Tax=Hoylesella pleuritidis TaxID=407975 RepID=UPI0023572576|nr:hypothetical protein [Hoylesella pleuritidis]